MFAAARKVVAKGRMAVSDLIECAGVDIVQNSGRVPKWTKGTDCKSVIRRFESDLGLSCHVVSGAFVNMPRPWGDILGEIEIDRLNGN